MVAQLIVVRDIPAHADAARVEMLAGHSVIVVGNLVLVGSPAHLPVDQKTAVAGSEIRANERRLQAVAETRGRIETGGRYILRPRSQVAKRRTRVQIPSIHVQSGNVGADLNPAEIQQRARMANNVAGDGA